VILSLEARRKSKTAAFLLLSRRRREISDTVKPENLTGGTVKSTGTLNMFHVEHHFSSIAEESFRIPSSGVKVRL
jgi:hypothetical protein